MSLAFVASVGVLTGFAVVLAKVADGVDEDSPPQRPFDRSAWVASDGNSTENPRCGMRDAVLAEVAVGMSAAELADLLGPADLVTDDHLTYNIGGCNALTIDVYSLEIRLESGRTIGAIINVAD